jgi:predicted nuclease with TOPRIM domain
MRSDLAGIRDWCIDRLTELRGEYEAGAAHLAELDGQRAQVRDQLLRIEGAIRVLEEQCAAATRSPEPEPVLDERPV